ncbi:hypothetical protein M501DRAFT_993141 [Patellaria atrata CBS 101060]|uniref:Uncharacterized protein n=1 Tax=Patellaria atrata CBS 101060 TaxID=1346257 RepID=A0A9P4SAJ4_9PEZI|nr:hypothetical protein M501DRAFT_993141 [Patellaria atrata CBS 101060]
MDSQQVDQDTSIPLSSQTLSYPTVEVNDTIASIASDSINMRSSSPEASNLEESSYEVLGDSAFLTDDDGATTESLASIDGHTPEDTLSIADTDFSDSRAAEDTEEESEDEDQLSFLPHDSLTNQTPTDSAMTMRAAVLQSTSSIKFDEPNKVRRAQEVVVRHTIRTVDRLSTSSPEAPTRLNLVVKQTLSDKMLVLDKPFRILFVGGQFTHWARQDILAKIASALATGASQSKAPEPQRDRSSRFSVFPIPFSAKGATSPEVELIDSSGIELIVDDCTGIVPGDPVGLDATRFDLIINGQARSIYPVGRNVKEKKTEVLDKGQVPDLAVFGYIPPELLPEDLTDRHDESWYPTVRKILKDIQVPTLDVTLSDSMDDIFHIQNYSHDPRALHMSVETGAGYEPHEKLEEFPVSLPVLLGIDAGQLNRHLACLTGLTDEKMKHISSWDSKERIKSAEKYMNKKLTAALNSISPQYWRILAVFLLFALSLMVRSAVLSRTASVAIVESQKVHTVVTSSTVLSSSISPTTQTVPPPLPFSSLTVTKSGNAETKSLSKSFEKSLGHPNSKHFEPPQNNSNEFEVLLVGDQYVILTPPKRFAKLKKAPTIHARALRDGAEIPSSIKLVESVYLVELPPEESYGTVTLNIWTASKPLLNQTFEIDLGFSWLKMSSWNHAAFRLVETLSDASNQISAKLQGLADHAGGDTRHVYKYAAKLSKKMQKGVQAQLEEMSQDISEMMSDIEQVKKELYEEYRKAREEFAAGARDARMHISRSTSKVLDGIVKNTPSLRKSTKLKKAKRNADSLARKIGISKKMQPEAKKCGVRDPKTRKSSCPGNSRGHK